VLEHELLLGDKVARADWVDSSGIVEHRELDFGAEAEIAGELADVSPVLQLDGGTVVPVARG